MECYYVTQRKFNKMKTNPIIYLSNSVKEKGTVYCKAYHKSYHKTNHQLTLNHCK